MRTYHLFAVNPSIGAVEVADGDSTYGSQRAARRDASSLVARWRAEYGLAITGSALAGYRVVDEDGPASYFVDRCRDAECIACRDFRRSVGME